MIIPTTYSQIDLIAFNGLFNTLLNADIISSYMFNAAAIILPLIPGIIIIKPTSNPFIVFKIVLIFFSLIFYVYIYFIIYIYICQFLVEVVIINFENRR